MDMENVAAFPEQSANLFGLVCSHHSEGFIFVALIRDSEDKNASDGGEEKPCAKYDQIEVMGKHSRQGLGPRRQV